MRSRRLPSLTFLLCLACAAVVATPLWLHRWLPIQDLPQHLATLRIVHEVHTAVAPTSHVYVTHLGSTQYLLFYILGDLLSYVVDVRTAGLLIITGYMLGTVAALYRLLRTLGRDPRLSILVVPLLTNSQLLIGLIQFVIGIPLMLYGWSLAIETLRTKRRRTAIGLAVVALLVFYSHVVVFGVFGLGLAVFAPWRSIRRLVRYWMALVPVGIAVVYWAFFTASGDFVRSAIMSGTENKDLWPFWASFRNMYELAFDTYPDSADEKLFAMFVAAAVALTVLSPRSQRSAPRSPRRSGFSSRSPAPALYFRSEGTNGFLGHIRDRFALLARHRAACPLSHAARSARAARDRRDGRHLGDDRRDVSVAPLPLRAHRRRGLRFGSPAHSTEQSRGGAHLRVGVALLRAEPVPSLRRRTTW